MLVHHTDCGMATFSDEQFRQGIEAETGIRPSWLSEAFIPHTDRVRGFVFDVATGAPDEVDG